MRTVYLAFKNFRIKLINEAENNTDERLVSYDCQVIQCVSVGSKSKLSEKFWEYCITAMGRNNCLNL